MNNENLPTQDITPTAIAKTPPPERIEWEAPEYDHFERASDWYWTIGLVALAFVLLAILMMNFLFAIIIVIGTFTIFLYASRPPKLIRFALTPRGVEINDRRYPYDKLHGFWISDEHHKRKIMINSDRFFLPHLIILLPEEVSDDQARDYLLQYLPETRLEESFADLLSDYLGF